MRNLLTLSDPHQLAECLNGWLQANLGTLPRPQAVDGKLIRDRALSLCLSDHETGAPVALGFAKEKTKTDDAQSPDDYKREGEQTIALRLYATTNLENATVTGDALNNNQPQARAVLDVGGNYFFQLKNENRHAYQAALHKVGTTPPFAHTEEPDTRHGRVDQRRIAVYAFEPLVAGLPGARSLVVIERTSTFAADEEPTIAFYTSSHAPTPGCAGYSGELAHGHWGGSESRNHRVCDACMREDRTRSKNHHLKCNLSALRVCLVALKAHLHPQSSWPALQECCQHDAHTPFQALLKQRSK